MSVTQALERWQRAQELFDAVCDLPPDQRTAYLDAHCADPALRAEVDSLIAADEEAEAIFLEQDVAEKAGPLLEYLQADAMGADFIGPYRLLEPLGRGGMGAVYRAAREDGHFRQTVALKLLRPGLPDAPVFLQRFRYERQILAGLQHPGIARLLDGGQTEDGRPYFVLEYVEGVPITDYCDQHKLSTDARLRLFQQVCEAVQYAHQNLVVHRDLKPTNILVTADGTVKLLDFGIAKLLGRTERVQATVLETGGAFRLMTPAYASPEQIRGETVTTTTDVYQLGVLLYELLTSHRPYRLTSHLQAEVERVILQEPPTRPSTVIDQTEVIEGENAEVEITPQAVTASRATSLERLRRRLRGDLDNIVLKALRKEPDRRYGTAAAFAQDVQRHLDGQPVEARPASVGYRVRKFVERHRAGVAAAAVIVLLLLTVTTLALRYGVVTARQARAIALERDKATEVKDFLLSVFDAADPNTARGTEITARELLDQGTARVHRELADQPLVQAEVMAALAEVHHALGLYATADSLNRDALALRQQRLAPNDPELAKTYHNLAATAAHFDAFARADSLYRTAIARIEGQPEHDLLRAHFLTNYALNRSEQGQLAEADSLLRAGLAIRRAQLEAPHPDLAESLHHLGGLQGKRGDFATGDSLLTLSLEQYHALYGPVHPDAVNTQQDLAMGRFQLNQLEPADSLMQEVIRYYRLLFPDAPPLYLAVALSNQSLILNRRRDFAGAEASLREALAIQENILGRESEAAANTLHNLGMIAFAQQQYATAESLLREAVETRRRVLGPAHPSLGSSLSSYAMTQYRLQRLDAANALVEEAVAIYEARLGPEHPQTAATYLDQAIFLTAAGTYAAAAAQAAQAQRALEQAFGPDHWQPARAMLIGARAHLLQEKYPEAEGLLLKGYEIYLATFGPEDGATQFTRNLLRQLYTGWGKPEAAAKYE